MSFKKTTITISNSIYGEREQAAYAKDGIAISRVGKAWGVFHNASQTEIYYKLQRRTKAEATKVAEQILELPVDWHKSKDDLRFVEQIVRANLDIRRIAG